MKKIGLLITSIVLLACSPGRKISSIKSQIKCNKTIHFVWDKSSDLIKIETQGTFKNEYASFTKRKKLDYKKIFIESLENLNKKYKTKLFIKKSHGFPSDTIIQVTIKIDEIIWNKGFSNASMDNSLIYKTNDNSVQIAGISKNQSIANADKSLLQSFEHGNLLFLLASCEN